MVGARGDIIVITPWLGLFLFFLLAVQNCFVTASQPAASQPASQQSPLNTTVLRSLRVFCFPTTDRVPPATNFSTATTTATTLQLCSANHRRHHHQQQQRHTTTTTAAVPTPPACARNPRFFSFLCSLLSLLAVKCPPSPVPVWPTASSRHHGASVCGPHGGSVRRRRLPRRWRLPPRSRSCCNE